VSALIRKNQQQPARGEKTYRRRPLANYYRSDTRTAQSPFRQKPGPSRRRVVLFNILDILLLIMILAVLVYSLMLRPEPTIKASLSDYHSDSAYAAQITPLLSGLKNSNKLSFDEAAAVTAIKHKFPEVQAAQIELPFFSPRPVVWLDISPPAFNLTSEGRSYLIDQQGTAVAETSALPPMKLLTITDQTGFKVQLGSQVLSSQNVAVINTVIVQSKAAKVPVTSLSLPAKAEELDLHTSDQPYYVKFNLGGDGRIQAGQFLAARHQFIQDGQKPAEYLDVRVPGKIFYK
jgi:hypothetical protein